MAPDSNNFFDARYQRIIPVPWRFGQGSDINRIQSRLKIERKELNYDQPKHEDLYQENIAKKERQ
jgi:hypothetical protein